MPGGHWGMVIACGAGFFSCLFVLVIGFLPPGGEHTSVPYPLIIGAGYALLLAPPFILARFRRPSWVIEDSPEEPAPA